MEGTMMSSGRRWKPGAMGEIATVTGGTHYHVVVSIA
jgi:hypothetical protein